MVACSCEFVIQVLLIVSIPEPNAVLIRFAYITTSWKGSHLGGSPNHIS